MTAVNFDQALEARKATIEQLGTFVVKGMVAGGDYVLLHNPLDGRYVWYRSRELVAVEGDSAEDINVKISVREAAIRKGIITLI